jgi:hypothetical protein
VFNVPRSLQEEGLRAAGEIGFPAGSIVEMLLTIQRRDEVGSMAYKRPLWLLCS